MHFAKNNVNCKTLFVLITKRRIKKLNTGTHWSNLRTGEAMKLLSKEEMTLNPFLTCFSRIVLGETMRRLMFETVAYVSVINLEQLVLEFTMSEGAWSPLGS